MDKARPQQAASTGAPSQAAPHHWFTHRVLENDFWRSVLSSVLSALIVAYLLFMVAGTVAVGALGEASLEADWVVAGAFLALFFFQGASLALWLWASYLLVDRRRVSGRARWIWFAGVVVSSAGLEEVADNFHPAVGYAGEALGLLLALWSVLFVADESARLMKWSDRLWRPYLVLSWCVIALAFVGQGFEVGVLFKDLVDSSARSG